MNPPKQILKDKFNSFEIIKLLLTKYTTIPIIAEAQVIFIKDLKGNCQVKNRREINSADKSKKA